MLFQGTATALVTPFKNEQIDYSALEVLIEKQIEAGVSAICISGTTGEAPTIEDADKRELFKRAGEMINKRVHYIAGTGTNYTKHIIRLCGYAQEAGADSLLINNPYYNKSSDDGVFANYEAIDRAVQAPIIVYNVPSRTGKNISPALALRLCELPHVAAFKEASGDISQIAHICAKKPKDIALYSGNDDQIVPIMALGGDGVISVVSNIAPKEVCDITTAALNGNYPLAAEKAAYIFDLFKACFCDCNPIPIKTALYMLGWCEEEMILPLVPLTGAKRSQMASTLSAYGFEVVNS